MPEGGNFRLKAEATQWLKAEATQWLKAEATQWLKAEATRCRLTRCGLAA
jgi:hypothetical protein